MQGLGRAASAAMALVLLAFAAGAAPRTIKADMDDVVGVRDLFWQDCVGSGHAALLLRPENLAQLKLAHDEAGFVYVRFHGIFSDDMGVYREVDGKPVYDFSKVDAVYGAILKAGMKPFVEIGPMPDALAIEHRPIFYWKFNGSPPKDDGKWADLTTAFVRHLIDRFGKAEVESWRFEVWNEPNLDGFWNGASQEGYFKFYDVTANAIKAVDPALWVGGPATAGAAWVTDFLKHAKAAGVGADFVTTHTYGVAGGFLDEFGQDDNKLIASPDAIVGDVRKVRKEIEALAPGLPLYFTEWSTSYNPRDPVHDAYLSAPYILDKLKNSEGLLQSMSYWVYSDLFEEPGPPPTPFHGGFGLINREGIRKPAFFAYKYLNTLGPLQLAVGDARSWATKNGDDFALLTWDYTTPDQGKDSNRPFFRKLHPAKAISPVVIEVTHLKPGMYRLAVHRTGYRANDAYSRYIDWGLPDALTDAQVSELQALTADAPETDALVEVGKDGRHAVVFPMRSNDVVLLTLTRVK